MQHSGKISALLLLLTISAAYSQNIGPNINGGSPGGAAGGDLSGTYPNPTVAKVAGTTPGTGVVTAIGNALNAAGGLLGVGVTAGGDLSGTLPSPTVAKVNGNTPGGTCTNQVVTSISSSAVPTCASVPAAAFTSRTFVGGGSGSALSTGTTYFMSSQGLVTTETGIWTPVSANVTLRNFSCQVGFAVQASNSIVCTVRTGTNGSLSDSTITCTIAAGTSQCQDVTHTVALSAFNSYDVKLVTSAGASGTGTGWSLQLDN